MIPRGSTKVVKKTVIPQELLDIYKADPILDKWGSNFRENLLNKYFSKETARPLNYLNNIPLYKDPVIILIAAGPSLDKNIKLLKNRQNNCIIICVDVVLFKLIENGIKPDFVVNVDPSYVIKRFWKNIDTSDLTLVCPTTSSPEMIGDWRGNMIFFNQKDRKGEPKGIFLNKLTKSIAGFGYLDNNYFVGATAYLFGLLLKPKIIILMGYDFGFSNNKSYCNGFLELKYLGDVEKIKEMKVAEVKKEIKVKLSTGDYIYTTHVLKGYKNALLNLIKKNNIKTINATEGGILLEIPQNNLSNIMEKECVSPIDKIDIFNTKPKKRKRRKKK